MAMCSQEEVSWRTRSPYQIWLAKKVEEAVERALHCEGQQIQESAAPRKCNLPQICQERLFVTKKIHSLLLQWRPDFSAEWSLKLRRALPILEILFAHLAYSKEDFSNPLLIEPRLKEVLSLLDSNRQTRSPPWCIQSSSPHRFANYLYCLHYPCHHICYASQIEAEDKASASKFSLHVSEENFHQCGQESPFGRSYLNADKDGQDDKGDDKVFVPSNLNEPSEKAHKAFSAVCESCLYGEEKSDTKAPNALVFGSCLGITKDHDERFSDDTLEWSTVNLPPSGTVASLMASELRSSRKEEANQALWNALASEEVALLKDNLHKHGEFASKWMVRKIQTMIKRSKTMEKQQKVKKIYAGQLLRDVAGGVIRYADLPTTKMRKSLSRGLSSLFSCHTIASREHSISADQKPLPSDLEALELNRPDSVVYIHSQHIGQHAKEEDLIHSKMPNSCSSSMISINAASLESSSDVGNNDGNDSVSSHTIYCANDPMDETSVSLVTYSTRTNSSEELICSRSKDLDDRCSRNLSENVSACTYDVAAGTTVRALPPGHGCIDMQVDLGQIHLLDSNDVVISNQVAHNEQSSGNIMSAEGVGHTYNYDQKGASMESISSAHKDSELHGSLSIISPDNDDDKDVVRWSARRTITEDPVKDKKEEGTCSIEAYTGVKGKRENLPSCSFGLQELGCGGPCRTSLNIRIDESGNMKKHRKIQNTFSHGNNNDQKLAEDKMQTSSLYEDRQTQEEGAGRNTPHVTNNEAQLAQDPTESRSMRSRDGESSSGSQRGRTPLGSLLAETQDWNALSTRSFHAWESSFPWATWEEPNEALDPLCCVCMMGLKGAAFTSCGHTFCRRCSRELWQGRGTCPLCNKLITGILDIF